MGQSAVSERDHCNRTKQVSLANRRITSAPDSMLVFCIAYPASSANRTLVPWLVFAVHVARLKQLVYQKMLS